MRLVALRHGTMCGDFRAVHLRLVRFGVRAQRIVVLPNGWSHGGEECTGSRPKLADGAHRPKVGTHVPRVLSLGGRISRLFARYTMTTRHPVTRPYRVRALPDTAEQNAVDRVSERGGGAETCHGHLQKKKDS